MKLFVYNSHENAPFDGFYQVLGGGYQKIIFSNDSQWVEKFTQQEATIKTLLSNRRVHPEDPTILVPPEDEKDDIIFFIPSAMIEKLIDFFKRLFQKTEWQADQTIQKPSTNDIGIVGDSKLSQFYNQIETEVVLTPLEDKVKTEAKTELVKLFNYIAEQDNEIDAVLVTTYTQKVQKFISSDPKPQRSVDLDTYTTQLRDLVTFLQTTKKENPKIGLFDHAMFQYKATSDSRGGIIHLTHLPEYGDYTFLIFVSATEEGIEMLELYRHRNLPKIKELLDTLLAH